MAALAPEFERPYMRGLRAFLAAEKQAGQVVFPPGEQIFAALNSTPLDAVRVVILGQDPYHGDGQAHGLSFSVPPGVPPPPSLVNVYRELEREFGHPGPRHGYLGSWAQQGVLLLNSVLTVRRAEAGSHRNQGWEQFTDRVISVINEHCDGVVFLLWGAYAQRKGAHIDSTRHCILKAPHPSPLSAHRGFIGCGHFAAANAYLESRALPPIDWQLPTAA